MRCYFMKNGHITAVEMLHETSDQERISEARQLFDAKASQWGADGFEVWDGARFVYRYDLLPLTSDGLPVPAEPYATRWGLRIARALRRLSRTLFDRRLQHGGPVPLPA